MFGFNLNYKGKIKNNRRSTKGRKVWQQIITRIKRADKDRGFYKRKAEKILVSEDPVTGKKIYVKRMSDGEFVTTMKKGSPVRMLYRTITHRQ